MKIQCKYCEEEIDVPIEPQHFAQWKRSQGYIQDLADYLDAGQRELLISKTCDKCWKKMFPEV